MATIWKTADGGVLWCVSEPDAFVLFTSDMTVRSVHESGAYSYEDELYEWTVCLEDDELRKHTRVTQYGQDPTFSCTVVVGGLSPIKWPEAREVKRVAREAYAAHQHLDAGGE